MRTHHTRLSLKILAPFVLVSLSLLGCNSLPETISLPTETTEPTSTTVMLPMVVSYDDKAAFEAAASGPLQLVDFDTDSQGAPIVAESPGVLAGAYYKSYGILFSAGVIFGEPNLPFNGVSAPNTITDSGDNTPTPAIVDVDFGDPVHEVGITNIGAEAELRIFDEADVLIGSVRSDADEATKDFIGLIGNIPIRRMEYDFAGGMSFEGDDFVFTLIVP